MMEPNNKPEETKEEQTKAKEKGERRHTLAQRVIYILAGVTALVPVLAYLILFPVLPGVIFAVHFKERPELVYSFLLILRALVSFSPASGFEIRIAPAPASSGESAVTGASLSSLVTWMFMVTGTDGGSDCAGCPTIPSEADFCLAAVSRASFCK